MQQGTRDTLYVRQGSSCAAFEKVINSATAYILNLNRKLKFSTFIVDSWVASKTLEGTKRTYAKIPENDLCKYSTIFWPMCSHSYRIDSKALCLPIK